MNMSSSIPRCHRGAGLCCHRQRHHAPDRTIRLADFAERTCRTIGMLSLFSAPPLRRRGGPTSSRTALPAAAPRRPGGRRAISGNLVNIVRSGWPRSARNFFVRLSRGRYAAAVGTALQVLPTLVEDLLDVVRRSYDRVDYVVLDDVHETILDSGKSDHPLAAVGVVAQTPCDVAANLYLIPGWLRSISLWQYS